MNVLNRVFCLFFLSWLCFFTPGSCKAFLKNCSFQSFNASFLEESPINKRNDRNSSNNNEIYYSLNELGTVSDHMSLSNRNLLPEVVTLAEISSEIDEAKVVTHHFVANVYLQVRSYLNTPSGVCIFVVLMLLGLLIVAKIFLASNFLKRRQETQNVLTSTGNDTRTLKKSNISEEISKNNYLSALQEEKSGTYKTANSNVRKSFNTFSDFKLAENYSMAKKKNGKKPSSEKNYKSNDDQTDNFQDFSQAFEEDVDMLMHNIDLEDQIVDPKGLTHGNHKDYDKKIKEINILGQQIILNGKTKKRSVRAYSETNDNDQYYDVQDNYFSDCNLSEIHNLNK